MKRFPFKEPSKASWTTGGSCLEVCKLALKFFHYRKFVSMGKRNWQGKEGNKLTGIFWQSSYKELLTFTEKGRKNAIQCLPLPLKTLILAVVAHCHSWLSQDEC